MKIQLAASSIVLLACISFASVAFASQGVEGLSLKEAFDLALKRSEDLQIQEEQVIQAEEKYSQAKGALFPTVNLVATALRQDSSATFVTSPTTQNTTKISAVQPLFRGLREYAALRQQKKSLTATSYLRDQAKTQLFMDVSNAYYTLMILFHDVTIFKNQIETNQKRLKELKDYRRIGRSRESDVLSLEATIAALEASIEATNVQLENAWSVFAFLTGVKDRPMLSDDESIPSSLPPLSEFLAKLDRRPDLKASQAAVLSAEEGIDLARGGHFPSLDLLGNYYFNRPGVLAPVKWDVQLAFTFPIFQGGIVQSQVRQASSAHQQAELTYQKAKRAAAEQIEQLYNQVKIETSQQDKQQKASELAKRNYEAQLRDSRLGLSTNIDVLTSLSSVQESLRLSNRIHYQARMDYLKLLAAVAERPKQ